jgi:hypothetical protein
MGLPTPKQLRDLVESQLGRAVHLHHCEPLDPTAPGLSFAIYVDSHLATQALVVADLPAAAYLGAASRLVPVRVADAAITEGTLPELIAERFRALLGGWTALFGDPGPGRPADEARLYRAVLPGQQPPRDMVSLAAAAGQRLDLSVDVHAYGRGDLALVRWRPGVS